MNALPSLEGVRPQEHITEQPTLTLTQVCQRVQKSRWTLWRWIKSSAFPAPINAAGHPLWSLADVLRFESGAWSQSVSLRHGSQFAQTRRER